ncbi:zinc dependent phospholipase C family protein [Acidipila sp. EB88]|uniref:zinc dependent phospholipase C family protein n=1 Tax=Acidipila sp. EB88 TaxID=2305226 RepID=UPI001315856F|nr:zinc dependent phospholipase C family protein [Acidipila sp. EB88]
MSSLCWRRGARRPLRRAATRLLLTLGLGCVTLAWAAPAARAYSVLTHEELIDLAWEGSIAPLLRSRYPGLSAAELENARAYAYGGCVIQDIGYYPFGDPFFSDLTHYVRSGDFVVNLFRDAHNANELAFAIGALSHYIGDTVGHAQATNLAVPVEFPGLARRYGPSVNYAEAPHAHVQTEFAFDINEIAHHRFAPLHYLRHVGLHVPVRQLESAFYETYGLHEGLSSSHSRRINVRGYRFAVHSFLPRIAYAVTVLHRSHMPADTSDPVFQRFAAATAQVAAVNNWGQYRKTAGIGTYALAGVLFVLPKVGPLKLVAIKGPSPATERDYVGSVMASSDALNAGLSRFGAPHQTLPNRDLDTGAKVKPGGYPLTDSTYASLLHRITAEPTIAVPAGLKADVEQYYADPASPITTKQHPEQWARVQADLHTLATMPVRDEPLAAETE